MTAVERNLEECQEKLQKWSNLSFGNITWELIEKKKKLKEAGGKAAKGGSADMVYILKEELKMLLYKEEKLWQQRAVVSWKTEIRILVTSTVGPPTGLGAI